MGGGKSLFFSQIHDPLFHFALLQRTAPIIITSFIHSTIFSLTLYNNFSSLLPFHTSLSPSSTPTSLVIMSFRGLSRVTFYIFHFLFFFFVFSVKFWHVNVWVRVWFLNLISKSSLGWKAIDPDTFKFQPNASSGMGVADHSKNTFMELKQKKVHRYVIFKVDEKKREVVVEKTGGPAESYDDFAASLPENDCRYAVFDFDFVTSENCQKSKIFFIAWLV